MFQPHQPDLVAQDLVTRFLSAPFHARLPLVRDPASEPVLRRHLGAKTFAEYRRMASLCGCQHLAGGGSAVVVIPGVMGSVLASHGLGGVWWLDVRARHHIKDLRLGPDGMSDADPGYALAPVAVDLTYEPLFLAMHTRSDLDQRGFPYDWRKSLETSVDGLAACITAAAADTAGRPVHLVAHSMGGLLVRVTLMRHPDLWKRIGKIVFLGTPHYGSPAIAYYLKHHLSGFNLMALLGRYLDRAAFRSMWGVLSLLPAPAGVYPDTRSAPKSGDANLTAPGPGRQHPCADFDLYDADAWHMDIDGKETTQLQTALTATDRLHRDLFDWHATLGPGELGRMLVIAGVGYRSLFRVCGIDRSGMWPRTLQRTTSRVPSDPHREGDGRVPLASAQLEWIADTRYTRTEHGRLPHARAVHDDICRFLADQPLLLPSTPAKALRDHLQGASVDAVDALLGRPETCGDDPGYLHLDASGDGGVTDGRSDAAQAALEAALAAGQLPAFERLHLL